MSSTMECGHARRGRRLAGITAGLLLLGPLLATAAAPPPAGPPDGVPAHEPWGPMGRGPGGEGPWGHGPGPWHGGPEAQWRLHPRFLHGIRLTDEQQDRIFAIEHAAAPALREQVKALRKAHEGLRNLGTSPNYDEARAKALTEAMGRAAGQLLLLRIRGEHDIYSVLTPEQQSEVARRRQRWEANGPGHDPRGGGQHGDWQGKRGAPAGAPPPPPSPPSG